MQHWFLLLSTVSNINLIIAYFVASFFAVEPVIFLNLVWMAVILSTRSNLKQITFMHSYTTLTHRLACCTAVMPHFQLQAETHVKAAEHRLVFYQQMSACKIMIRNDARTFVTLIYNDQVSCFPMPEMWAFWDDCQTVPSHTCVASAYIHPTPRVFF